MKTKCIVFGLLLAHSVLFAQEKRAQEENGLIRLNDREGHFLIGYQYGEVFPPAGIDSAFRRAGFIHPLNTLSGKTLTRIQPPDHYHHFGLWNPWTRVEYKGKVYDLWNLGDKQGTVRPLSVKKFKKGKSTGFIAKHAHIVFPSAGQEEQILEEDWDVKITPIDAKKYSCDITSTFRVLGSDTVTFKEYRYAGLGFRANEQWTNQNSKITTSSGKDRKDADGSLEKWVMAEGTIDGTHAGILFLSYPENYNHPEPIRVWPEKENRGRGDVFVNFAPTKNKDWVLLPGKKYQLRYRLIVFDDSLSAAEAEAFWKDFAGK